MSVITNVLHWTGFGKEHCTIDCYLMTIPLGQNDVCHWVIKLTITPTLRDILCYVLFLLLLTIKKEG
jgi:hypothetical protein